MPSTYNGVGSSFQDYGSAPGAALNTSSRPYPSTPDRHRKSTHSNTPRPPHVEVSPPLSPPNMSKTFGGLSNGNSSGQRYSMEQVEAFLNEKYGISMSENPAQEGGVRLVIDVAVFETTFPMKLEAFKRKLRDFHFRKVRNHEEYVNTSLKLGDKISDLKPRYPTNRRERAKRRRQHTTAASDELPASPAQTAALQQSTNASSGRGGNDAAHIFGGKRYNNRKNRPYFHPSGAKTKAKSRVPRSRNPPRSTFATARKSVSPSTSPTPINRRQHGAPNRPHTLRSAAKAKTLRWQRKVTAPDNSTPTPASYTFTNPEESAKSAALTMPMPSRDSPMIDRESGDVIVPMFSSNATARHHQRPGDVFSSSETEIESSGADLTDAELLSSALDGAMDIVMMEDDEEELSAPLSPSSPPPFEPIGSGKRAPLPPHALASLSLKVKRAGNDASLFPQPPVSLPPTTQSRPENYADQNHFHIQREASSTNSFALPPLSAPSSSQISKSANQQPLNGPAPFARAAAITGSASDAVMAGTMSSEPSSMLAASTDNADGNKKTWAQVCVNPRLRPKTELLSPSLGADVIPPQMALPQMTLSPPRLRSMLSDSSYRRIATGPHGAGPSMSPAQSMLPAPQRMPTLADHARFFGDDTEAVFDTVLDYGTDMDDDSSPFGSRSPSLSSFDTESTFDSYASSLDSSVAGYHQLHGGYQHHLHQETTQHQRFDQQRQQPPPPPQVGGNGGAVADVSLPGDFKLMCEPAVSPSFALDPLRKSPGGNDGLGGGNGDLTSVMVDIDEETHGKFRAAAECSNFFSRDE